MGMVQHKLESVIETSPQLVESLHLARELATKTDRLQVLPMHLMLAMLSDDESSFLLEAYGVDFEKLRGQLLKRIEKQPAKTSAEESTLFSPDIEAIMNHARLEAEKHGLAEIDSNLVLAVMLSDEKNDLARLLLNYDLDSEGVLQYLELREGKTVQISPLKLETRTKPADKGQKKQPAVNKARSTPPPPPAPSASTPSAGEKAAGLPRPQTRSLDSRLPPPPPPPAPRPEIVEAPKEPALAPEQSPRPEEIAARKQPPQQPATPELQDRTPQPPRITPGLQPPPPPAGSPTPPRPQQISKPAQPTPPPSRNEAMAAPPEPNSLGLAPANDRASVPHPGPAQTFAPVPAPVPASAPAPHSTPTDARSQIPEPVQPPQPTVTPASPPAMEIRPQSAATAPAAAEAPSRPAQPAVASSASTAEPAALPDRAPANAKTSNVPPEGNTAPPEAKAAPAEPAPVPAPAPAAAPQPAAQATAAAQAPASIPKTQLPLPAPAAPPAPPSLEQQAAGQVDRIMAQQAELAPSRALEPEAPGPQSTAEASRPLPNRTAKRRRMPGFASGDDTQVSSTGSVLEKGKLVEQIPRKMRLGVPGEAEVRITRARLNELAGELSDSHVHDLIVTEAMTVQLRAPGGGFHIENLSPQTQWIDRNQRHVDDADFGIWRWNVCPTRSGKARLQLVISARTVDDEGNIHIADIPDKIIGIGVSSDHSRALKTAGALTLTGIGGALAGRFGGDAIQFITTLTSAVQ